MAASGIVSLFSGFHRESCRLRRHLRDNSYDQQTRPLTSPTSPSIYPSSPSPAPPSPSCQSFSASLMQGNIAFAESLISKWDPATNPEARTTCLFRSDPPEACLLLHAVADLHRALLFFSSYNPAADHDATLHSLVRSQALMQAAIRRLKLELHLLLSSSPAVVSPCSFDSSSDPDPSSDNDDKSLISGASASPLRDIAETMIAAGYGKECVSVYKSCRKSIVDEELFRLGFEKLSQSQIQKLDWEALNLKIKSWLVAASPAIKTLIAGERKLSEHVFAGIDPIRESLFADITRDAAMALFAFPESIVRTKRSPEKIFRILDLYDAISDLWPEIKSIFSFDSTASVRNQALNSLLKLAEAARSTIADFESAIRRDTARSPVPGGGVHPLTRYAMNYIVFLADYDESLADVFADFPLEIQSHPPETISASPVATRLAWLVLVLLCKLDGNAEAYREVAQSYLFLANNLQYVVNKVSQSRLREVLGEEWVEKHREKVRHYLEKYERLGWETVAAAIPAAGVKTAEEGADRMKAFNAAFEQACALQEGWVVVEKKARDELRASVGRMVMPAYRGFYWRCRELLAGTAEAGVVRYAPERVRNRLDDLFSYPRVSGSVSGSVSELIFRSGAGSFLFCWRAA